MSSLDWQQDASCLTTDPEVFFNPETVQLAKSICEDCPVKQLCLQHAFEIEASEGVFGGFTAKERIQLKKKLTIRNKGRLR